MGDSEKVLSLAYKGLTFVPESARKRICRLEIEELDLSHNKLSYPTLSSSVCTHRCAWYRKYPYLRAIALHCVCKAIILQLMQYWAVLMPMPLFRCSYFSRKEPDEYWT